MVKFSLLQNGFDFFADAVEQLANPKPSPRQIKFAIDHLASAVELLIKYRLFVKHWSLVFQKPNEADESKVNPDPFSFSRPKMGKFDSVTFSDALKRLKTECSIRITKNDEDTILLLKDLRNQMVHYAFSIERTTAVYLAVHTWNFIHEFISEQIPLGGSDDVSNVFQETKRLMVQHKEFVEARNKRIEDELKQLIKNTRNPVVKCVFCRNFTYEILGKSGETNKCLFCLNEYAVREYSPQEVSKKNNI
jgi:hypothetical protein